MTEEEKAAELAKAEEAKKAEEEKAKADFEASLEGLSEEEKTRKRAEKEAQAGADLQLDYEAELKRERERREAAETAAADAAFKLREKKRQEREAKIAAGGDPGEEKPLTATELEAILERDRQQTRKELQSDIIAEKARNLAGSEAEANLIIEIHKNRTFPPGLSLDEQLEEAYAIANRKKLLARNTELQRALRSKNTASGTTAGTHRDSPLLEEPNLSQPDIQALKAAGFVWDGKTRLYVKQLAGGKKILTYDPKTKTRRVIEK